MNNIFSHKSLIAITMVVLLASSCGVANKSHQRSTVYYTKEGLFSKGHAISVNEKNAKNIAVRLARTEMSKALNLALSEVDADLGLPAGTHKEPLLGNTAIYSVKWVKPKEGNIECNVTVILGKDALSNWINAYYVGLPNDDILVSRLSQEEFQQLFFKHISGTKK